MKLRVFKESFSSQNSVLDIEKEFVNFYEARKIQGVRFKLLLKEWEHIWVSICVGDFLPL